MDVQNYSFGAFDQAASTRHSSELALQLRQAVLLELAPSVERALGKIVAELNEAGHSLKPFEKQMPGELHFRSASAKSPYDLLLACDIVITTAFREGHSST